MGERKLKGGYTRLTNLLSKKEADEMLTKLHKEWYRPTAPGSIGSLYPQVVRGTSPVNWNLKFTVDFLVERDGYISFYDSLTEAMGMKMLKGL